MFENERALKTMSSADIIDYSVEVYKKNFKVLTILSLIFCVPFSFIYSIISNYFSNELALLGRTRGLNIGVSTTYVLVSLGILVLYILYFMTLNAVLEAAVTKVIYDDIVYRRKRRLKIILKESFKKFFSLLGYRFFLCLILIGVLIGTGFLLFVAVLLYFMFVGIVSFGTISDTATVALALFSIVVLGVICFFVLVLASFFFLKTGFGIQAIAIENKTASQGVSRSMSLSRSNFWNSFWALFFGIILYFFIPMLSIGVVEIFSFVDTQMYARIYVIAAALIRIIQSVFYPFAITLMTMVFISMKINNEGLDLELKVDKMIQTQKNIETGDNINVK